MKNGVMTVEGDDDLVYEFNREYWKLREMHYYAMYTIPEVIKFRQLTRLVTETNQFEKLEDDW